MDKAERKELERHLIEELRAAQNTYGAATEEYKSVRQQFGQMMDHPDGATAMANAARNERLAVQQFRAALKVFNDLVVYGRLPALSTVSPDAELDVLTPREVEVLKLIATGLNSKQIASQLGVSFKTVISHREHIMQKLDIHNVVGLCRYAIRRKLIEP